MIFRLFTNIKTLNANNYSFFTGYFLRILLIMNLFCSVKLAGCKRMNASDQVLYTNGSEAEKLSEQMFFWDRYSLNSIGPISFFRPQ